MSKFLTALEIAKLAIYGLPTTKSAILARAIKEGWEYREVTGLGGVRKEFNLPKRYQQNQKGLHTDEPSAPYRASSLDYEAWASKIDKSKFIPIRYCKDVQNLTEENLFCSENTPDAILFHQHFIYNTLEADPKHLLCIYVQSDSMAPTIRKTGVAMFDLSKGYNGEGVYLIKQGDELKIKRIHKTTPTKILIISDNKEIYPAIEIDLSQLTKEDFSIVGMYMWDSAITV